MNDPRNAWPARPKTHVFTTYSTQEGPSVLGTPKCRGLWTSTGAREQGAGGSRVLDRAWRQDTGGGARRMGRMAASASNKEFARQFALVVVTPTDRLNDMVARSGYVPRRFTQRASGGWAARGGPARAAQRWALRAGRAPAGVWPRHADPAWGAARRAARCSVTA